MSLRKSNALTEFWWAGKSCALAGFLLHKQGLLLVSFGKATLLPGFG